MISHAQFGSPSSLYRHRECPANVAYGQDIPNPPASVHAIEGTVFHSIMEKVLPEYLESGRLDVEKVTEMCGEYDDMLQHVQDTCERVDIIYRSFSSKHTAVTSHFELRVALNDDIFGTADVVFTGRKKSGVTNILVADFKYGRGVEVVATENIQAITYVLAAVKTLGIKKLGSAVVFIAQMRLIKDWHTNEKCRYIFTAEDAEQYRQDIFTIVARVKDIWEGRQPIEGNLKAGSHCRWCKCFPTCVEAHRDAEDALVASATEISVEEKVRRLTLDEQVKLFLQKSQIEDFLDAVAANLSAAFQTGVTHPALKLIQTEGRRGWKKDVESKIVAAAKKKKIKADELYNQKLKGIGDITKLLGAKTVEKFIEKGSGKIELVHADDKRPALVYDGLTEIE